MLIIKELKITVIKDLALAKPKFPLKARCKLPPFTSVVPAQKLVIGFIGILFLNEKKGADIKRTYQSTLSTGHGITGIKESQGESSINMSNLPSVKSRAYTGNLRAMSSKIPLPTLKKSCN